MVRRIIGITAAALAAVVVTAGQPASAAPPRAAEVFGPGVISTAQQEWRITFTPDGRTAYFARAAGDWFVTRASTIMVSHRTATGWTAPRVASFSGTYADIDPYITPDGKRLYFSSIRPVNGQPRTDADLWMVERRPGGRWSEPVHLGERVNSASDDLYPTVTADGTLFVGADRPGGYGGYDIWQATREADGSYGEPVNAGPGINSSAFEFNPTVVPGTNGAVVVFASFRTASIDLFYSVRVNGEYRPAKPLGAVVNTEAHGEMHPSFSPSGDRFYFVRSLNGTELGDIYSVPTADLIRSTVSP